MEEIEETVEANFQLFLILIVVAGRLGAEQWNSLGSNLAAVTERATGPAPAASPIVVPIAVGARPAN